VTYRMWGWKVHGRWCQGAIGDLCGDGRFMGVGARGQAVEGSWGHLVPGGYWLPRFKTGFGDILLISPESGLPLEVEWKELFL
jgi:hypothetical protein